MRAFLDPRVKGGIRWFHLHVLAILVVLLASTWAAAGGYLVAKHFTPVPMTKVTSTGYKPDNRQKLPPLTQVIGGPSLPASFSLSGYLVRQHNQGGSFSCVGQTLATDQEIVECERYKRLHPRARYCPAQWFSSGWIWNAFNGASYSAPISYSDAYPRWQYSGMAPITEFYPDGWNDWWLYPPSQTATSYRYHIAYWHQLSAYDPASIKQYIYAGIPVGIAMPWHYSLANNYGYGGTIWSQWGDQLYWHSTLGIGFNADGVEIQNSFGASWGQNGHATLSWGLLQAYNAIVVVGVPANSLPPFKTIPRPVFPVIRWNGPIDHWNATHPHRKHSHIAYRWHGHLSRVASDAWHSGMLKRIGGPLRPEVWDSRRRVMHQVFGFSLARPQATVWSWPTLRHDPLRYEAHHRTIRVNPQPRDCFAHYDSCL